MLISRLKPWEEILGYLSGDRNIFIVGCKGCAEACETGGEADVLAAKVKLESEGKNVTGYSVIDFLCDKALVKVSLLSHEKTIIGSDSLLVMSCGIGIQATSAVVDKVVHPATNTISVGGAQGMWPGEEICRQCGDCMLEYTGGICPVTACTKSLINGPCGGAKDGNCEFEPDVRQCGWERIYNRLKKLNRLDIMKKVLPPKDYAKASPPKDIRGTIMWAIEAEEEEKEVAA